MRRLRLTAFGAAAALTLSLGLVACGGSSSGGDDTAKQAIIDELVSELEQSGDVPPGQIACIREGFTAFSVDELTLLRDSETDTEVPQEVQDKIIDLITGCVLGESPSPAAS